MDRAYSLLTVKGVDEDARVITGIATTPATDRVGDIVDPMGVSFKNPLPFLWQHEHSKPIGTVKFDKPTKAGITFTATLPKVDEAGALKDRIDEAWQSIKLGLVKAVSIGFRAVEYAFLDEGGIRFIKTEIFELSAVTIPANAEATILTAKKFDTNAPSATGHIERRPNPTPPATGKSSIVSRPQEGLSKMNIGAKIAELEASRKSKMDEATAIQSKAMEASRPKDADEQSKFDQLKADVESIDKELTDLRFMESSVAQTVQPVNKANTSTVPARVAPKLDKGIAFAQLIKVRAVAMKENRDVEKVAVRMYGENSIIVGIVKDGEQVPGSTASGTWGVDLISSEGAAAADFAEYLRPATILGKFGQGNVPALRRVPFRRPLILGTGGATGYWVGEGKPKPVSQANFDRSTLDPLKCATIVVLTEENIRDSSPSSDVIIRDDLRSALAKLEDEAFIDPTNAGSPNVKPAGILYTAGGDHAIAAESYSDETDVILDIRSLMQRYIDANNPAGQAVLIMEEGTALAAGLILNALGQRAFPGLGMRGGELQGVPVITSENVTAGVVSVVNASDVLYADDGEVAVDMSREASIEMKDQANITQNGIAGTGAAMVSMFQNNMVAIRAEHTLNWKRRRPVVGAYLTGVAWGGAVNVS